MSFVSFTRLAYPTAAALLLLALAMLEIFTSISSVASTTGFGDATPPTVHDFEGLR